MRLQILTLLNAAEFYPRYTPRECPVFNGQELEEKINASVTEHKCRHFLSILATAEDSARMTSSPTAHAVSTERRTRIFIEQEVGSSEKSAFSTGSQKMAIIFDPQAELCIL